jgi:antirestriction protein ArdC
MKTDIHADITQRFIEALENGTRPWERDWLTYGLPTRATGQQYRGINMLILADQAEQCGYSNPHWLTFKQAAELGGNVRKGERSTAIVFYKQSNLVDGNGAPIADANGKDKAIWMLRRYNVFNVEQVDGLPDGKFALPVLPTTQLERNEIDKAAEAALRSTGAQIKDDGNGRAFYRPATDSIHLPRFEAFTNVGGYLTTMAHELCHWTGAKHRLDRDMTGRFGSKDYAFEELVAEIGAAFVCARLGIAGSHFDNHAAYVSGWLEKLRGDKKFIFKAAALAQKAADLVLQNAAASDIAAPVRETVTAKPITPETPAFVPQPAFIPQPAPAAQFTLL